jgi:hypothetical protein
VMDTENKSASLYADLFNFDFLDISPPFTDSKFIDGVNAAVRESHVWACSEHAKNVPAKINDSLIIKDWRIVVLGSRFSRWVSYPYLQHGLRRLIVE